MSRIATHMLALAALVLPVSPASSAPVTSDPSYDYYYSWAIACDNGLRCTAKGLNDMAPYGADLSILRDAGPSGGLTIRIAAAFPFSIGDLMLDDEPLNLDARDWTLDRREGLTTLSTHRPAAARAFVERIRNASSLGFSKRDDNYIPLAGLTAALLRMDERQGRTGTVTALIRRGKAPASSVPSAPALPRFLAARPVTPLSGSDAARLIEATHEQHAAAIKGQCLGSTEPLKDQALALDEGHALVLIPCVMANNGGSSLAFIAQRKPNGTIEPFRPVFPYADHPYTVPMLTEAEFNAEKGILYATGKRRDLADCGVSAEWVWMAGSFHLSSLTRQDSCGGSAPGEWLVLYRSR